MGICTPLFREITGAIGVGILFLGLGWDFPSHIMRPAMVETRFIASNRDGAGRVVGWRRHPVHCYLVGERLG